MIPSLKEAIDQQAAALAELLHEAVPMTGLASLPMPPVSGRPVVVKRVPRAQMARIVGQEVDGTVMRHQNNYVIFLSDPPRAAPCGVEGEEIERYYAWHEYEHIVRGDVFGDDHAAVYARIVSGELEAAERETTEAGARRYIAEALARGAETEAEAITNHFGWNRS